MITDPIKRGQKVLRYQCLSRDGRKCVISGIYDSESAQVPAEAHCAELEAAHIITFCLGSWKSDSEQREKAAIWVNLYRYFPGIRGCLSFFMENLNDTLNVMMLEASLHKQFGTFQLALESTNMENRYHIKLFTHFPGTYAYFLPSDRTVISSHDSRFQLPNSDLLSLHASGRAEIIDKILDYYEATRGTRRED
ncbi:hypothetical protein MPDQ_007745 [Monascus purpureus]|uniref:HNH nuclease domain-containing protein n=1 Tax=Monascus purpureus TaxID=5098 RepID=A0A507QRC5_MONPU|nr:hypothetical protein MPDQ_007745 [Monascus purpureus]